MTPHKSDRTLRLVRGFFGVACIVLLMLLARDYHTPLLILIGVIFGIGVLTFAYDRSTTLWGLALVAGIGYLSLVKQGHLTLALLTAGVIFGTGALLFVCYDRQHLWHWWFPDQPFNPTVKRWLRYGLQVITAGVAYVHARFYVNLLTGVDPGNFPTALAALTVLNTLMWWLLILPSVMLVMTAAYMGIGYMAGLRGGIGSAEIGGISADRWEFRAFGAISTMVIGLMFAGALVWHPWPQRAARLIAATVLVLTEFSYDQTCAISSKRRLVAQLKDRRERPVTMISIAEEGSPVWLFLRHFTFFTGTCADQRQP